MARSLLRTGRINPQRAQAVLSVSTETAVYSQQAFLRGKGAPDQGDAPTTGFSSLVDSNTEAATSSRDDGTRQPNGPSAAGRGDDSSSAQPSDTTHAKGKTQPARGDSKAAAGTDGKTRPDIAAASGDQQPADTSTSTEASTSTDISAVVAQATTADTVGPGLPSKGDGKDKTTTKADATADGSTTDAAVPTSTDQATTLVVAVVAQVTTPNSTTPATPTTDAGPTAVTAVSSAPGAIAAAAASKVAADVAASDPAVTTAQPETTVVLGQSGDPKAAATDQAQVIATAQPSASQSTDPTATQPATVETPAVQADIATLTQAVAAAQTPVPAKTDALMPSSTKAKATTPATDDKAALEKNPAAVIDPQPAKAAATDDDKSAYPVVPKKSATTIQARDTSDQPVTKAQSDADASTAVPALHQHAAAEAKVAQPSTIGTADLSGANAAQAAAATAAATTPAPVATAALNTANLTVLTGQAVPLSGLAVEISANAKAGNSRFEIRLDPPDLGRIDVRLDVDKNGQVTSRLFVEKSETLDLLRRDAPQLQQALQDAGLKTGDSSLQFSLRDQNPQQGQNNSGNNNGNGQNAQRLVIAEDDTATANAAGRSYGRSLSPSGGVDIRV